ncbi:MAG: hypothetical protein AAF231_03955 [Pseudomonadota bacterium]
MTSGKTRVSSTRCASRHQPRRAALIDGGKVKSTVEETFDKINPANFNKAHKLQESGEFKCKLVLEGS